MAEYDKKIQAFNTKINGIEKEINEVFTGMFGNVIKNSKGLPTTKVIDVVTLQRGYDLPEKDRDSSGTIEEVHCVHGDYWPLNTSLE